MFAVVSSPVCNLTPMVSSNGRNWKASLHDPPPASRIYVRNLSYSIGEATLIKEFSKFGKIIEVKLAKHEESKRSKGYAFIQYGCQDDAMLAIEQMDQKMLDGRVVYAEIAKPNGFVAYPRSMGPPLPQKSVADAVRNDPVGSAEQMNQL